MPGDTLPRLEPGLVHLRQPGPRSTALHRLVLHELRERDGEVVWLDARNVASTYVLYELAAHDRRLDPITVARAFTAHQHHTLVRRCVRRASARTAMVVAPNVASLYEDDDVPAHERDALFGAALELLAELAATYEIPVVVTTDASSEDPSAARVLGTASGSDRRERHASSEARAMRDFECNEKSRNCERRSREQRRASEKSNSPAPASCARRVARRADATLDAERTSLGLRFEGEDFATNVYVNDQFWQTTIPYWVELLGSADSQNRQIAPADFGPERLSSFG